MAKEGVRIGAIFKRSGIDGSSKPVPVACNTKRFLRHRTKLRIYVA